MKINCIGAFLLTLIVMVFFYHRVFERPNEIMFSDSGDGIKAYTVYAGHILNDSSYINYRNMNYPYGQSHIYTDGQFLISNIIKLLSNPFPWLEKHSIGIYNLIILFSFPLCAFFLSLVLNNLKLPGWYVCLVASCISLLAPQIFRTGGHLTLTYAFCIPLSWWLLIRYYESGLKPFLLGVIIAVSTAWFFIHPYYTIAIILLTISFLVVWIIRERPSVRNYWQTYLGYMLQIIAPLALTQAFISITDHHKGRPQIPSGFWENFANVSSVFAPSQPPFHNLFASVFKLSNQHWEGWSFVGLPLVFVLLFLIGRAIYFLLQFRVSKMFTPVGPPWLGISLWASVIVLVYAMAFPYRLQMEFLLDWFPSLRQFRALGRFAWVFYFVFSVYGYYVIWQLYKVLSIRRFNKLATLLLVFVFGTISTEIFFQQKINAASITTSPNYFNRSVLPSDYTELVSAVDSLKKSYQCLVPLPFYHIGTDNFTTYDHELSLRASMVIAYWCNIPLLASSTARSPLPEAKNILQFFSFPFIKKEIQKDLPDKRPFLLLYTGEDVDFQEKFWLARSKKIWNNEHFQLLELSYESVFSSNANEVWEHFDKIRSTLWHTDSGWLISQPGYFYYNSLDSLPCPQFYRGNGAFENQRNDYHFIFENHLLHLPPEKDFILSFWYYNEGDAMNQNEIVIKTEDPKTKKSEWLYMFSPARSKNIDGNWTLVEEKFRISDPNSLISIFFAKQEHSKKKYFADEFMIRPVDADVYKILKQDFSGKPTKIIWNNYLLSRE